jgi:hypothetical protein
MYGADLLAANNVGALFVEALEEGFRSMLRPTVPGGPTAVFSNGYTSLDLCNHESAMRRCRTLQVPLSFGVMSEGHLSRICVSFAVVSLRHRGDQTGCSCQHAELHQKRPDLPANSASLQNLPVHRERSPKSHGHDRFLQAPLFGSEVRETGTTIRTETIKQVMQSFRCTVL